MLCYNVEGWGAKGIALAEGYQERDGRMSPKHMLETEKAREKKIGMVLWKEAGDEFWAFVINARCWAHVMLGRGRIDCGLVAFVANRTKRSNGVGPAGDRWESRAANLLAVGGDWDLEDRSRQDDDSESTRPAEG